jgi:hypothetical protein
MSNILAIEADMNRVSQRQKRHRKDAQRRGVKYRRVELTSSQESICTAYVAPITITF